MFKGAFKVESVKHRVLPGTKLVLCVRSLRMHKCK